MSETDRKYRDMANHPYVKYLKRKIDIKDEVIARQKKKLQAMKSEIIKMRREIISKVGQLENAVKDIMYVNDIFDRIKEKL